MEKLAHDVQSAAGKVAKSASSAATKASKSATSAATKASKGIASGASKATSAASKLVHEKSKAKDSASKGSARGAEKETFADENSLIKGLVERRISAAVQDLDFFRKNKLLVVETNYIIHVKCITNDMKPEFGFILSKNFAAFRTLVDLLYKEAEQVMEENSDQPQKVTRLAQYCDVAFRLIESQSTEYLGKVSYTYVQSLAKQRSQLINDFLEETTKNFPDEDTIDRHPFARRVAVLLEKFFLTDHCESAGEEGKEDDIFGSFIMQPLKKNFVPHSKVKRESKEARLAEEKELVNAKGVSFEGEQQQMATPEKSTLGVAGLKFADDQPLMAVAAFAGVTQVLRAMGLPPVTTSSDVLLVICFACFCLGMQALRLLKPKQTTTPQNAAKLMRMSMVATSMELSDVAPTIESPMPRFPDGAKLGSVLNSWSDPPSTNFMVRGENYLSDKKKIKSDPFVFPNRGVDLFLTDQCPENVGRISTLLNSDLRSVPTFIINFRLPWGVLLLYFEIPEHFVPFIKCCYGDESINKADLEETMKKMSNSDRCVARFLLGNDEHKNNNLKIFPGIVEGPWVVKASVGGKPAIIGTKLPVNYVYQPEDTAIDGKKQSLYLEADLDIVSSKAARGILSVCRSYTQELTIDLGFAVQGNSSDELPEQMLTGARLHGIDPLNAPPLPPMKDTMITAKQDDDDDDDESVAK